MPRVATFVVLDQLSGQSNVAMATVNFNTIDNPPVLDTNGPASSGNDITTLYTEGNSPVPVNIFFKTNSHYIYLIIS